MAIHLIQIGADAADMHAAKLEYRARPAGLEAGGARVYGGDSPSTSS